jgi:hypothetical protein
VILLLADRTTLTHGGRGLIEIYEEAAAAAPAWQPVREWFKTCSGFRFR